jgi:hypothetical protein
MAAPTLVIATIMFIPILSRQAAASDWSSSTSSRTLFRGSATREGKFEPKSVVVGLGLDRTICCVDALPTEGREVSFGEGRGEGFGEGRGDGLGEGREDGLGEGRGDGLGEGRGDGLGEGRGEGLGDG